MVKVQNVRCYRTLDENGVDRTVIAWDLIVPSVVNIKGFNIYRMDLDKPKKIKSLETQNFYLDNEAKIVPGKDYYYKVTYVQQDDTEGSLNDADKVNIYTDKPSGFRERLYWVLQETVRRVNLGFINVGENVKIYIKKKVGTKCPKCYHPIARKSTDPRCSVCWGTGIIGGYDSYIGFSYVYDSANKLPETPYGNKLETIPRAAIANYPLLHDGDTFKRQDNTGYIIGPDVTSYKLQNYLIEQIFGISHMDPGHPVYRIDI
jgi:hypothetical protein